MRQNALLTKCPGRGFIHSVATGLACVCILLSCPTKVNAQATAMSDIIESPAQGDIMESGASLGHVDLLQDARVLGRIPIMVPADIFALGNESSKSKVVAGLYNDDPTDPFYYSCLPSTGEVCIGYRDATAKEMIESTMGQQPTFALASRNLKKLAATTGQQWVWKNNPLNYPRWALGRMPLKIYISGRVEMAQGGLVSKAIKSALMQWAAASNGVIQYQMTTKFAESDIYFAEQAPERYYYDDDVDYYHTDAYYDKLDELAFTDETYHMGQIDRARVMFRGFSLRLPQARVQGLCLREVGFALGLRRASPNSDDAMSLQASRAKHPVTVLSERDNQEMAALYEKVPAPANWLHPIPVASSVYRY